MQTPTPGGSAGAILNAVSCATPALCVATGSALNAAGQAESALAQKWNGTKWTSLTTPAPGGSAALTAVSCLTATHCVTVGNVSVLGIQLPLAELWNGVVWKVLQIIDPTAGARHTS